MKRVSRLGIVALSLLLTSSLTTAARTTTSTQSSAQQALQMLKSCNFLSSSTAACSGSKAATASNTATFSSTSTSSSICQKINNANISYIDSKTAKAIDESLMSPIHGFSLEQLMELAGLSVAAAANDYYLSLATATTTTSSTTDDECSSKSTRRRIVILCGPGNNGGDGLVAARHLKHFGFEPTIVYPKQNQGPLFKGLVKQCTELGIEIKASITSEEYCQYDLAVDALLGFSFAGPLREPFASLIQLFVDHQKKVPIISVDIPSGWEIDLNNDASSKFMPGSVISLTLPKLCMKQFSGVHYLGGRFIPPSIASQFDVTLAEFGSGSHQFIKLTNSNDIITNNGNENVTINGNKNSKTDIVAIYVTAPTEEEAKLISKHLVGSKLASLVNIIGNVSTIYDWEGSVAEAQEVVMVIKTRASLVSLVEHEVKSMHSYKIVEIITHDIDAANLDYINWVKNSTTSSTTKEGCGVEP